MNKIAVGLQALGAGFTGGDAFAPVKAMREEEERAQRKQAIGALMDRMSIGGAERGLLDTLPTNAAQEYLLNKMNPTPMAGKVIGDKLVNPVTGQVMGDYGAQPLDGSFLQKIGMSESGNNFGSDNGLGYVGRVQFGEERLADFANAMGSGPISLEQFRTNPELQKKAEAWHFNDLATHADRMHGHLYGQKVNGKVFTREAAMGIAHLGGKGGLDRYVETDGGYNPKDAFGTHLSDYHSRFAGTTFGGQGQGTPDPVADIDRQIDRYDQVLLSGRGTDAQRRVLEDKRNRLVAQRADLTAEARKDGNRAKFRPATAEEAAQYGAQAGQIDETTGRFYPITVPKGMRLDVDPETGALTFIEGNDPTGGKSVKTTEGEKSAAGYLSRMTAAEKGLQGMDEQTRSISSLLIGGTNFEGLVLSEEQQKILQFQRDWVRAKLRKESGAVIGEQEMAEEVRTYFPLPGEGPELVEQKRQARLQAQRQFEIMSGNAVDLAKEPAPSDAMTFEGFAQQPRTRQMVEQSGFTAQELWEGHPMNPESENYKGNK